MSDFLKSGQLITGSASLLYKGSDGIARTINPSNYQPVGSYATTAQLNEVKTSVSNGKSLIASAITDKGVSTASDATFQTMANNIRALSTTPTFKVPVAGTDFSYTGAYQILDDANGNWRIKLLTSGTFKFLKSFPVDLFLVGGGAGGAYGSKGDNSLTCYGRGGCGGYTKTIRNKTFAINSDINVIIGIGGGAGQGSGGASIFGSTSYQANGGTYEQGGSGGGNGRGAAGSDGADGNPNTTELGSSYANAKTYGKGQGTTTREFGEPTGDLYSGGGGGCNSGAPGSGGGGAGGVRSDNGRQSSGNGTPGIANTGGGGGASGYHTYGSGSVGTPGSGGSGIIIIRNKR